MIKQCPKCDEPMIYADDVLKAQKKGLYENFGQKEYINLKDKYSKYIGVFGNETDKRINEELDGFFNWCINFDQNSLRKELGEN